MNILKFIFSFFFFIGAATLVNGALSKPEHEQLTEKEKMLVDGYCGRGLPLDLKKIILGYYHLEKDWNPQDFIASSLAELKKEFGKDVVDAFNDIVTNEEWDAKEIISDIIQIDKEYPERDIILFSGIFDSIEYEYPALKNSEKLKGFALGLYQRCKKIEEKCSWVDQSPYLPNENKIKVDPHPHLDLHPEDFIASSLAELKEEFGKDVVDAFNHIVTNEEWDAEDIIRDIIDPYEESVIFDSMQDQYDTLDSKNLRNFYLALHEKFSDFDTNHPWRFPMKK